VPDVLLSLAAGTILDATAQEAIAVAADAGFDALGLRFDAPPDPRNLAELTARLDDRGLRVLDVEVARLRPGALASDHLWLIDIAAALGASYVLSVSNHDSRDATVHELGVLAEYAQHNGVRIALEFMRFTSVRSLGEACTLSTHLASAGLDNVDVLLDVLHFDRCAEDLGALPAARECIGYVQICDATGRPTTDEALANEARHHRMMPGAGQLPVAQVLARLGALPISVEVQSDELAGALSVRERAELAMRSTRAVLDRVNQMEGKWQ